MSAFGTIGQPEWATQDRVVALFRDELGYRHLGDWSDRDGNSNIEEELLSEWLLWYGYAKLIRQLAAAHGADLPAQLNTPGRRALYNNLTKAALSGAQPRAASASDAAGDDVVDLALRIDYTVKAVRHDGWRGVQAREQVIKQALFGILQNIEEVERIFLIIKAQKEY
jgi:hypothetical protein